MGGSGAEPGGRSEKEEMRGSGGESQRPHRGDRYGQGTVYLYYKPLQIGRMPKCGARWQMRQQNIDEDRWEKLHAAAARATM